MAAPARSAAAEARLAGLQLPQSGAWLHLARGAALSRLRAMGLPVKRDEYWKYTDPTALTVAEVPEAQVIPGETEGFDGIDCLRLVFVDGVFDAAASDNLALPGLEISRLAEAATQDIHWAHEVYGVLEARGQTPVARPLAALNSALATDGILIRVMGKVAKPVSLFYHQTSTASDAILHHCVKVEEGGELTLLESGPAGARANTVMEVEVADGAAFHHIRTQGRDHERRTLTHIFGRMGRESRFKSFTLTANGALTRNEVVLELIGADGVAHVAGAALGNGTFHHDDTVFITHQGTGCESRQVFKKVLRNGATGVFQGKILVKQSAQKTDGYQISQSLLLDDDSQFLCKPELEIYADDVKCSHGSTSGAIDDTALFYLRSRGVPEREAQSLLVLAFLAEAIAEIDDATIAEAIQGRLESWLAAGAQ